MWAFSDESERASAMLLGLLTVPTGGVIEARRRMRSLLLPGQRRIHMAKESPTRRRRILVAIGELDVTATVFVLHRPLGLRRIEARHQLLGAAAMTAVARGTSVWVLDHQDDAQAARDRQTLELAFDAANSAVSYDHRSAHEEPLLWAIDGIVWAVGAGGDWRRRIARGIEVTALDP